MENDQTEEVAGEIVAPIIPLVGVLLGCKRHRSNALYQYPSDVAAFVHLEREPLFRLSSP